MKLSTLLLALCTFGLGTALAEGPPAATPAAPPASDAAGADGAPVDELLDQISDNACLTALKGCKEAGLGLAWTKTREACAELRTCKQDCRKGDIKDDKNACLDTCKSLKGKPERDCKQACRKDARAEKRDCKDVCRDQFKTPACKDARKGLAKGLLECAKKAGPPCVQEAQKLTAE